MALQKRFILSGLDICVNAGLTQVHACEEENWKAWVELSKENLIKIRVYLSIFYFSLENFHGTDNFPKYPNEVGFQSGVLNSFSDWSLATPNTNYFENPYENHGLVTADRIKV